MSTSDEFSAPETSEPTSNYSAPEKSPASQGEGFDFAINASTLWKAITEFFTGKSEQVIETVTSDSGSPRGKFFWLFAALANAAVLMVFLLISALRADDSFGNSGGLVTSAIFLPPIFCVVFAAVRALALKALFAFRKSEIGFVEAANIASLSSISAIGSAAVFGLMTLAPTVSFFWWLAAVAAVFCFVYSEILIFVAVQRRGGFDHSIVFTHSWLTAAWFGVTLLITSAAVRSWIESQFNVW